jgi:RLL motif-containing protein 1
MGAEERLPKALVRKLGSLGYPELDSAGLKGDAYCKIVLWLEEEKIRLYTPAQRKPLREFNDAWVGHATTYARELGVQADGLDDSGLPARQRVLNQLVNLAVHDVYRDKMEAGEVALLAPSKPIEGGAESQRRLRDLVPSINRLLEHVKLPKLSQDAIDTDAIAALRCLKTRLCPPAKAGPPLEVDTEMLPEGLDIKDVEVRKVAGVLRLLHGIEMGQLQVNINETINELQILTADPKTDSKLGKVGT